MHRRELSVFRALTHTLPLSLSLSIFSLSVVENVSYIVNRDEFIRSNSPVLERNCGQLAMNFLAHVIDSRIQTLPIRPWRK